MKDNPFSRLPCLSLPIRWFDFVGPVEKRICQTLAGALPSERTAFMTDGRLQLDGLLSQGTICRSTTTGL